MPVTLSEKTNHKLLNIAIVTRGGNGSPLILARSLKAQLEEIGVNAEISEDINVLNRLVSYKDSGLSLHYWLKKILFNYISDRKILNRLKAMDAVIISECTPNGFWKRLYNIEKLKAIVKKPVLFYEVYYLGNAPTQIEVLQSNNDPLLERYDGHIFVSPVTELRWQDKSNAFCIGLLARTWNLKPLPKQRLVALVDFVQPGYEQFRIEQIQALQKAGIDYISLERRYSIEEIRNIYRDVSIFFVQFPEAFGLPILECLCTGAQIFTPDSAWPMSWRLDESPEVHGKGILPECFTVYDDEADLSHKLMLYKKNFDSVETPLQVNTIFKNYYPTFYDGNKAEIEKCLDFIKGDVK